MPRMKCPMKQLKIPSLQKKPTKTLCLHLPEDLYNDLSELSGNLGSTKKHIVVESLKKYMYGDKL